LIKQGEYEEFEPKVPDLKTNNLNGDTYDNNKAWYIEDLRDHHKEINT